MPTAQRRVSTIFAHARRGIGHRALHRRLVESGTRTEYDYDAGVRRLIDVVNRQYYSATENIAQAIQRDVLEGRPQLDDAAVLFIAVTDVGFARGNATKTWAIDARSASAARRAKRAFLWRLGEFASDGTDLSAPELIFGELVGNVARHTPGMRGDHARGRR